MRRSLILFAVGLFLLVSSMPAEAQIGRCGIAKIMRDSLTNTGETAIFRSISFRNTVIEVYFSDVSKKWTVLEVFILNTPTTACMIAWGGAGVMIPLPKDPGLKGAPV